MMTLRTLSGIEIGLILLRAGRCKAAGGHRRSRKSLRTQRLDEAICPPDSTKCPLFAKRLES